MTELNAQHCQSGQLRVSKRFSKHDDARSRLLVSESRKLVLTILTLNQLSWEDKYTSEFEPSSHYRGWWNWEVLGVFGAQQAIIIINGDYIVIDAVGRKLFLLHPFSWAESTESEHGLGDCGGDLMPSSRTLQHCDLLEHGGPNLVPFCSRSGFRPFFTPHYFTVFPCSYILEGKKNGCYKNS